MRTNIKSLAPQPCIHCKEILDRVKEIWPHSYCMKCHLCLYCRGKEPIRFGINIGGEHDEGYSYTTH